MDKLVQLTFLLDEDLRRRAKVKAAQTGQSMASVLRECLRKWVEEPEPGEPDQEGEAEETKDS